jgi:hypothetical protein
MLRATLAALLLGLGAAPALAADTGFYLGAGLGQGSVEDVDFPGFEDFDGDDTGWKVIGGWRPIRFVAVEANYVDLGSASDNVAGGVDADIDTTGFDVLGMLMLPLFIADLYVKAGVVAWQQDAQIRGLGSFDDDGTDLVWGVGGQLRFGSFAARLEFENFEISNTDTDMLTLGVTWTFD